MSSQDLLLDRFYLHCPPEDLAERSAEVKAAIAGSARRLAVDRDPGETLVRVFNPTEAEDGWTSRHTAIQVSSEDMPFLVDSVLGELEQRDIAVHLLLHPQMRVRDEEDGGVEVVGPEESGRLESWMYLEVDRIPLEEARQDLRERLVDVLADVRAAYEDWGAMRQRCHDLIIELETGAPATADADTVQPTIDFLRWLDDHHFTYLGYREYELDVLEGEDVLRSMPGTGLGILRDTHDTTGTVTRLRSEARATAREPRLLTITKANSRATVHRPVYLDYIGVRRFDAQGEVVGERRFLGLFTNSAYAESVTRLPVIGAKVSAIVNRSGFAHDSHSGKDLMTVLENYPRDELFQASIDTLSENAGEILLAQERRSFRLFVRKDEFGRFVSALVYLPRDRFNTGVRVQMERILVEAYGAESVDFATRVGDQVLAQIHYVLRMPRGAAVPDVDSGELEERLQEASRSWQERLTDEVQSHYEDEETTGEVLARYASGFPEAYKEDFDTHTGLIDLKLIRSLETRRGKGMPLRLYAAEGAPGAERRLKLYRDREMSLSEVLPVFTDMGVEVTDERPYTLTGRDGVTRYIYDFGIQASSAQVWEGLDGQTPETVAQDFEEAFGAVWDRTAESDSLNALVLTAGLTWREVVVVRTVVRYLRQVSTSSLDYVEEAFVANPGLSKLLVDLFRARFDPDQTRDRERATQEVLEQIGTALDDVASLDQDRIIRTGVDVVMATLRTNFYRTDEDGQPKPHVSLKINPRAIEGLPEPRPAFEIWVYAPRVEGVHLRFGAVARGGLRWSDRREDFRTEVLGLVKAQMVKNAVIVPTGSKGGFFAKSLPDPSVDREAWLNEGKGAYRIFIKGMLDVTDNRVDGKIVPPERVVRHDGDDPYLVVAADKGTATFSDLANGVSREYGFWLDDAFASGGSAGYDHKGMGITARGAWESVKRHFRELGVDTQSEDFTVVGVGDMSGDVFGNGMLLSEHIRLVAAFDHRDIFLDPNPDAARSHAERRRLFELPRSSWQDYDTTLLSEGGGVHPRSAKSIPLTPQVRERLGIDEGVEKMTPNELLSAILRAPVDLLWNGGIGTYVKASTETHGQIGDRSNDAIRVDGRDLRVKVVGEGGNLGFSQRGRIEAARAGVHINTDAIDNSAGVDTSDHEVNIKIALSPMVTSGELSIEDRDELLASMTDEVAEKVLRHNYEQNVLLGNGRYQRGVMVQVHERLMDALAEQAGLDRELEFLPDSRALARLERSGEGLTSPEFAVLLAYSKLALKSSLLESEVPDDEYLTESLLDYFPGPLRERFGGSLVEHPLRREIIVNQLVNNMVNRGGVTFAFRATEETGASYPQVARAYVVCREVFGLADFVAATEALDNQVPTAAQSELYLEFRRLLDRAVRWFLNTQSLTSEVEREIERFRGPVAEITPQVGELLQGTERKRWQAQAENARRDGIPAELADRYASLLDSFSLLDVVELAEQIEQPVPEVAAMYYATSERFRVDALLTAVSQLPRADRWASLARGAVRDDLYGVLRALTRTVMLGSDAGGEPQARIDAWTEAHRASLARVSQVLSSVSSLEEPSLAPVSVALRTLRGLVRQGATD